jgi:L-ascorbate metabolism protein UlaG (beta-lactamase superfamily)
MHITWLGQTCVKLQTKYQDEDVTVLIDAYRPDKGEFPRNFSPTIALFSNGDKDAATVGQAFVLSTLGEVELKEVMVTTWPAENTIIFKINAEGMALVHLGRLAKKPSVEDLEKIGHVDILVVPVGGGSLLDAEDAAAIVTTLEPRMVVPIAYHCDTDPNAKPVAEFIKEMGLKPDTTDKKIIVKKKDLPQEETKLMILEKS